VKVESSLVRNFIILDIDAPFTVGDDAASSFKEVRVDIRSGLYNLVMISASIVNWEARYGDSNPQNYMLFYPNIKVEKIKRDEGTVYILTDKLTRERFLFASRSVKFPPGYLGI